ncbi:polysaccharide lyase [Parahaliea mediterranea]|uniref:Polysaccharide lyase 14 domain-containing protein n=1 Tax=Parahaliea mediterranea TaxID=651086 RepID=A0A939DG25_9GAMM|nr:hypothetical protein [Parahaliea mediterranea]MBN7797440.1 hypothetical protein [Parahaliea mediterranea]
MDVNLPSMRITARNPLGRALFLAVSLVLSLFPVPGLAIDVQWNDGDGGATRRHALASAGLPWDRKLGDWSDAAGEPWGRLPWASATLSRGAEGTLLRLDVTELVEAWYRRKLANQGFYLRLRGGGLDFAMPSREAGADAPVLNVDLSQGSYRLPVVYDTTLDASTSKALGDRKRLKLGKGKAVLLYFDLSRMPRGHPVTRASLELKVVQTSGPKTTSLEVYNVHIAPRSGVVVASERGLARDYPADVGIAEHPAVVFSEDFSRQNWQRDWFVDGKAGERVENGAAADFVAFDGPALAVTIAEGEKKGLNIRYRFSRHDQPEPEEAYFRYYLRFGSSWNQTVSGGKLPGFAGTYRQAGWGSRRSNGTNGWSARGSFRKSIRTGPPGSGDLLTPIGSYVYHVDQDSFYGNTWTWSLGSGALLENERWYSVEQHVRLNSPGEADGLIRAWLDGQLVFERRGLRFRTVPELKIEDVWFNVYHGGTARSPRDQVLYIDNVVVATEYIGPLGRPD